MGVVHRDLKPSNVIVEPSGRPVLTDFGAAKADELETRLTTSGVVIGEFFGVFVSIVRTLLLIGWVNAPGSTSLILFVIGGAQGALLGITTLLPLRRILERPE